MMTLMTVLSYLTALRLKQEHIQLTVRRTGDWNQLLVVSGISCFWQDSWIIPGENTEERRQRQTGRKNWKRNRNGAESQRASHAEYKYITVNVIEYSVFFFSPRYYHL